MNGYDLTRNWYNFKFENPHRVRHIHSDMYFYIVNLWNRLGQTSNIGLPTSVTMQSMNIGSYNTYKKVIEDLVEFGFLKTVSESRNQHQSRVVALSISDEASDKALDKALYEASDKPTDTINKPLTLNYKEDIYAFTSFWETYGKKKDTKKCMDKWKKIKDSDKELIKVALPIYVAKQREVQFRKNPLTWLNGSCWLDETHVINMVPELDVKPLANNEW